MHPASHLLLLASLVIAAYHLKFCGNLRVLTRSSAPDAHPLQRKTLGVSKDSDADHDTVVLTAHGGLPACCCVYTFDRL